jgi:predicted ATPase
VTPGAPGWTRQLDSQLVGRETELTVCGEIYGRAVEQGSGELVTIMGAAGVGKSRLSAEFLAGVADGATVLTGQCLPYGEGITFRPIVSAIRDLCGIGERDSPSEAREKLWQVLPPGPDAPLVGDRLAGLVGLAPEAPGILETFWAVRKLLEHLGATSPVVVLIDDIQWGEPTFLDLLEYLAEWIQSAPVVFICLARPELLEQRPGWVAGRVNGTRVALEPLSARRRPRSSAT